MFHVHEPELQDTGGIAQEGIDQRARAQMERVYAGSPGRHEDIEYVNVYTEC